MYDVVCFFGIDVNLDSNHGSSGETDSRSAKIFAECSSFAQFFRLAQQANATLADFTRQDSAEC